jgi:hypothetical protein
MKVIKKYTAIQVHTKTVDDTVKVDLKYGDMSGPYYSRSSPEQTFDTEEEAIAWAYEFGKWEDWLIVPLIRFDNH